MDISALLQQIFEFILQLLELIFNFSGGTDDSGDDEGEDS